MSYGRKLVTDCSGGGFFPNGCNICEVEIDPETGATRIERYSLVDDFGKIITPMMVAGQVHGGVAQGIGQALIEQCIYDDDSGQLLSGSFMDDAMPSADDMPCFDLETNEVPCKSNPLGAKGASEAGTTGSPSAVINAIVDALSEIWGETRGHAGDARARLADHTNGVQNG